MVKISKHSGIYTLKSEQHLKISLEEAWSFFTSPHNLVKITPESMGFRITSPVTNEAYEGQIISYKLSFLSGIKSNWVTEITHVKNREFFVDEQRFGPYKMWHHEHHFKSEGDGVTMIDKISYKLPVGILGQWLHPILVKKKLQQIFEYRGEKLELMFNR